MMDTSLNKQSCAWTKLHSAVMKQSYKYKYTYLHTQIAWLCKIFTSFKRVFLNKIYNHNHMCSPFVVTGSDVEQ